MNIFNEASFLGFGDATSSAATRAWSAATFVSNFSVVIPVAFRVFV
jgi:hypothetical protein